jgi:hypothetical protein
LDENRPDACKGVARGMMRPTDLWVCDNRVLSRSASPWLAGAAGNCFSFVMPPLCQSLLVPSGRFLQLLHSFRPDVQVLQGTNGSQHRRRQDQQTVFFSFFGFGGMHGRGRSNNMVLSTLVTCDGAVNAVRCAQGSGGITCNLLWPRKYRNRQVLSNSTEFFPAERM